jgi:tRNA pseudouridine32 synthase / 23S rRNA pseudouridine746 synthase
MSKNKPPVEVEACIPPHMADLLGRCGFTPELDRVVLAAREAREAARLKSAEIEESQA